MKSIDLSRLAKAEVEDWVMLLPNFIKLLGGLVLDPRVSWRRKAVLLGVIAYVISPIDALPDVIPGIGQLDDLALIALALRAMLTEVDESVVAAHWGGNRDLLDVIQAVVERATQWLPQDVLAWIGETSGQQTVDSQAYVPPSDQGDSPL